MSDLRIRTVTITLTQQCNLNCLYCYEHHKSQKKIDINEAKRIVDYEFENIGNADGLEFDLFGGEPFLAFEHIKEITEYIEQRKGDVPCVVFASTNGTLVHGEIQDWLRSHSDIFSCGLSIDGTREMHNHNRSDSYDDIDLEFFLSQYPTQDIKMTISQETLHSLAEGVIHLHKLGFIVSCNLAYEIDWSAPENETVLKEQLEQLIQFYLDHPQIKPCSMLDMSITNVGVYEEFPVRFCGAGIHMHSYDVDGEYYPCQFFMPLSVGKDKAEKAKLISFPGDILPVEVLEDKCKGCVVRSVCPNCFGANYASTGDIYKRDDNMCRLTKIIMKARSFLRAKQWELGQLQESDENIQDLLRAIVKIQEELEV